MPSPYDPDYFNICLVGRLRPDKNIPGMIKAISHLPTSVQGKIRLNIIGDGSSEYKSKLEQLVSNYKLTEYVVFHGSKFFEEKYNFMSKADMYLQPSFSEGISFSILDAFICGTPTVISRQSNMNYYIKNNAFEVIEPFYEDISSAIVELFHNSERRNKFRSNSQKLVQNSFYWPMLIKNYQDMYVEICNG